jgi:transcriptional regulator with XRE-family HTH domain
MKATSGIRKDRERFGRAFGHRLVRLRTRRQWSRPDLAQQLGVSRDRLAKWEAGIREPPMHLLIGIAKLLDVTLDELMTGKAPPRLTLDEQEKLRSRLEALQKWLA